jgi:ABC-type branched-subunit amino acid transport system ATPase component
MDLAVENLHAGYGGIRVLRGITFRVRSGEILGVLGRNGMGKTTLIRCLCGLLPLTEGRLRLGEHDLTRLPPHERARLGLTSVIEGRGIFPRLTVRENLEMGRVAAGRARLSRLDEVVGYFPLLGERMNQQAGTLSGGEQQMLAIGRALMTCPTVMLLDEPSDGVMPVLVSKIAQILVEINRREHVTTVLVEQNVPMVFSMTDHCLIIEKGAVVAEGSRDEISNSEVMRQYLAL